MILCKLPNDMQYLALNCNFSYRSRLALGYMDLHCQSVSNTSEAKVDTSVELLSFVAT